MNMNNIRFATKISITAVLLFSIFLKDGEAQQIKDHPNVLLIMIDDLNDWLGCMNGHPNALTPNIDRLAEQGMLFTNAHCVVPKCNPSRTSILSGVAPYNSGVYENWDGWHMSEKIRDVNHMFKHFKQNGYYTMMGGKVFHGHPDEIIGESIDESLGSTGGINSRLMSPDFTYPFAGLAGRWIYAQHWGPLDEPEANQLSDQKTESWAINQLKKEYDEPFFMAVGFYRPHVPLTAPRKYFERFAREEVYLPVINEDDLEDIPSMGRQFALTSYGEVQNGLLKQIMDRGVYLNIIKSYLASTTYVDAKIGNVLKALEESPYNDNTIIVLASDHGWSVGEQTHMRKDALWEAITRVPFIIKSPGLDRKGVSSDAPVSLLDIYPTVLDLCALPFPDHKLDGQSLRPLFKNPEQDWERPAIITNGPNNNAVRSDRWRYIQYADRTEELYDHFDDPGEWNNLALRENSVSVKDNLEKWIPRNQVPALNTDHKLPVTLSRKEPNKAFKVITPRFVNKPIHIEATIGPEISDGIIVCQGSQFAGYALYVKDGKLCFSVMDVPQPLQWDNLYPYRMIVTSREKLKNEKQEVEVKMNAAGDVKIYVNSKETGSGKAKTLSIHPAGEMILGEAPERFVPVGNYHPPFKFSGNIEKVTVDNKL